jgi:hypothetical protein
MIGPQSGEVQQAAGAPPGGYGPPPGGEATAHQVVAPVATVLLLRRQAAVAILHRPAAPAPGYTQLGPGGSPGAVQAIAGGPLGMTGGPAAPPRSRGALAARS